MNKCLQEALKCVLASHPGFVLPFQKSYKLFISTVALRNNDALSCERNDNANKLL